MSTNLLERPRLHGGWDPRIAATVALALVFLCGAAAGALAMNLERVQKELNLTPAQTEQVQSILNDMWQYYRTVLSDSKARVDEVLTPEQRQKFERLLQQQQQK